MRLGKFISIILAAISLAAPAAAQTTQPVAMRMPIGVWYQPISSFAKWKARGVNTLVGYESQGNTVTKAQWKAAAKLAGFVYWIQSSAITADDLSDPNLTGIIIVPDEPNGVGAKTPAQMQAGYASMRAMLVKAARDLPIWLDLDGNKIPYEATGDLAGYAQAGDVLGEDVYPFNYARVEGIAVIASNVKKLQAAGGKPVIAVIESSNQDISKQGWTKANDATGTPLGPKMRGPTAAEFTAEFNAAISAGVVGVVYFPDQIGAGWEGYDGTPADVAAAMTAANGTIAGKTVTINLPALPAATGSPAATTKPALPVTVTVPGYTPQTVQLQPQ